MPNGKATIRRAWHDILVYDEGDGRSIELDCPSLVEPPRVSLPAPFRWVARTPAWAHDRRDLIVDRLRKSGAIVYEVGDDGTTTVLSPDGTFRVECLYQVDERAPAWETTCLVAVPGDRVLVRLPLYSIAGTIGFPAPGVVVLPLKHRLGQRNDVRVTIAKRSFVLDGAGAEEPLELLPSRLAAAVPQARQAATRPAVPARPRRRGDAGMVFLALLFVAAGVWVLVTAQTREDRVNSALAILFFGACAIVPVLRPSRRGAALPKRVGAPPSAPSRPRGAPYWPLIAVLLEVPWILFLFMGLIFTVGDTPYVSTPAKERAFDLIAALPVAAGLTLGLVGLARGWARRTGERVWLALGCVACALCLAGFGWGLID